MTVKGSKPHSSVRGVWVLATWRPPEKVWSAAWANAAPQRNHGPQNSAPCRSLPEIVPGMGCSAWGRKKGRGGGMFALISFVGMRRLPPARKPAFQPG